MRIGLLRPISLVSIAIILSSPLYSYEWHVALHVFGAIIFLGNIVVTMAWMALAERTGETSVIRFTSKTVSSADVLFTGPGVVLVLLNGLALANERWGGWGGFHEFGWIVMRWACSRCRALCGLDGCCDTSTGWCSCLLAWWTRCQRSFSGSSTNGTFGAR
jgi:hypothetical protein